MSTENKRNTLKLRLSPWPPTPPPFRFHIGFKNGVREFWQAGVGIQHRQVSELACPTSRPLFFIILGTRLTCSFHPATFHCPLSPWYTLNARVGVKREWSVYPLPSSFLHLQTSQVPTYQTMWNFMSTSTPSVIVKTVEEGVERVRNSKGKYAFLIESNMNNYYNNRKPCDTVRVGGDLNLEGFGVAIPHASDLKWVPWTCFLFLFINLVLSSSSDVYLVNYKYECCIHHR